MRTPFDRPKPELTDDDREAWALYEAKSSAAAEQYADMPNSFHRARHALTCACGRTTVNVSGTCHVCRKGES